MRAMRAEETRSRHGVSTTRRRSTSVGGSYCLKGHDRKVVVDYAWRREEPTEVDDDVLVVSLVAVF